MESRCGLWVEDGSGVKQWQHRDLNDVSHVSERDVDRRKHQARADHEEELGGDDQRQREARDRNLTETHADPQEHHRECKYIVDKRCRDRNDGEGGNREPRLADEVAAADHALGCSDHRALEPDPREQPDEEERRIVGDLQRQDVPEDEAEHGDQTQGGDLRPYDAEDASSVTQLDVARHQFPDEIHPVAGPAEGERHADIFDAPQPVPVAPDGPIRSGTNRLGCKPRHARQSARAAARSS